MPFAVSATTRSGASTSRSTNERTCVDELGEQVAALDAARLLGPLERARRRPSALIWRSPVSSPTGAAPARHSLMPLYCAGLWLAVNIAPGASRRPDGEVDEVGRGEPEVDDVGAGEASRPRRTPRRAAPTTGACRGRRARAARR